MKKLQLILMTCCIFIKLFPCTGLFLKNAQNGYTYGRTLEFGQDLQSEILFVPHAYNFAAPTPTDDQGGLTWQTKYAAVGTNAFGFPYFVDGVNEAGLAGGFFYFPGFAEYQEVSPDNYDKSLPMWMLLTWILTTCYNVQDIKNTLPNVYVSKANLPGKLGLPPAHLIVHDATGKSLVVEYINGSLHTYDNPLGVITNSPSFDWHLINLRNYIHLSPITTQPRDMGGMTFASLGQGTGMLGLPGDFTPPSRFVRITTFTQAAPQASTELESIYQAFHLLNNFDIPKGTVKDHNGLTEYTQWTSAIDMKNKVYYIKTYEAFQLQKIELMKQKFDAKKYQKFSLNHQDVIHEITGKN